MSQTSPRAGPVVFASAVLLCIVTCLFSFLRLTRDVFAPTGNTWRLSWQQGDWLINRHLVEVRRSHIGSWILEVSDFLATSPLVVTFVLQAGLAAIALGLLLRLFAKARQPLILAPLVLSPGLFVIFWAVDGQGAFRKEIIAYMAVLLALTALTGHRPLLLATSALILGLGVLGHEVNILLLPLFLGVLWMFRMTQTPRAALWLAAGIALCTSLPAFLYAFAHRSLEDVSPVCAPLLQRGLDPEICKGAITWLGMPAAETSALIARQYVTLPGMMTFALIYALILLPVLIVLRHLTRPKAMIFLALLSAAPFLPLYPIATDWGRWISLHAFSMLIITMTALFSGYATVRRPPAPGLIMLLMVLSLLWAPTHMLGIEWLWPRDILRVLAGTLG
jgi:hypothetical protein